MPATTIPAELLYSTASLIESFKVVPLAPQFLRDHLFPRVSETASDQVAVDFYQRHPKARALLLSLLQGHGGAKGEDANEPFQPTVHQANPEPDRGRALLQERRPSGQRHW